jgi:preprotein translocase subunit SecB
MIETIIEEKVSTLKLHKMTVSNLQFSARREFSVVSTDENEGDKINCTFTCTVLPDGSHFTVIVGTHITPNSKAFDLKVDVTGIFSIESDSNEAKVNDTNYRHLLPNAVAIIFPFLRSHIASVSHMSDIGNINIPIFNIAAALSNVRAKESE